MRTLNDREIATISGGAIMEPSECANAMMGAGGFGLGIGGLIGALVGSLLPGPGTLFGAVVGAALFGGVGGAVAGKSDACQPTGVIRGVSGSGESVSNYA